MCAGFDQPRYKQKGVRSNSSWSVKSNCN